MRSPSYEANDAQFDLHGEPASNNVSSPVVTHSNTVTSVPINIEENSSYHSFGQTPLADSSLLQSFAASSPSQPESNGDANYMSSMNPQITHNSMQAFPPEHAAGTYYSSQPMNDSVGSGNSYHASSAFSTQTSSSSVQIYQNTSATVGGIYATSQAGMTAAQMEVWVPERQLDGIDLVDVVRDLIGARSINTLGEQSLSRPPNQDSPNFLDNGIQENHTVARPSISNMNSHPSTISNDNPQYNSGMSGSLVSTLNVLGSLAETPHNTRMGMLNSQESSNNTNLNLLLPTSGQHHSTDLNTAQSSANWSQPPSVTSVSSAPNSGHFSASPGTNPPEGPVEGSPNQSTIPMPTKRARLRCERSNSSSCQNMRFDTDEQRAWHEENEHEDGTFCPISGCSKAVENRGKSLYARRHWGYRLQFNLVSHLVESHNMEKAEAADLTAKVWKDSHGTMGK